MPEERRSQQKDEKLRYLKREEIKTMAKDIGALRETEAQNERQKIAKTRTEEEKRKQEELQVKAVKEAEERKKAAAEARQKEEEMAEIRAKRAAEAAEAEKKQTTIEAEQKEKEKRDRESELLKEKIKAALGKEEKENEERRKFLERVEEKAREKEGGAPPPSLAPSSAPPPPPRPEIPEPEPSMPEGPKIEIPKPELPKIKLLGPISQKKEILSLPKPPKTKRPEAQFKRPSFLDKLWIRIILTLLALAVLGVIATFWFWYFEVREKPAAETQNNTAAETETPPQGTEIVQPAINKILLSAGYAIPKGPRNIDAIIIHSAYNPSGQDAYSLNGIINDYTNRQVAAHYLIDREGIIHQTAPDEAVAFHAGESQMPDGRTMVNNFSIGIELIGTENDYPTQVQYEALAELTKYLRQKYIIPDANILGHSQISLKQRTDPWNFNWELFGSLLK